MKLDWRALFLCLVVNAFLLGIGGVVTRSAYKDWQRDGTRLGCGPGTGSADPLPQGQGAGDVAGLEFNWIQRGAVGLPLLTLGLALTLGLLHRLLVLGRRFFEGPYRYPQPIAWLLRTSLLVAPLLAAAALGLDALFAAPLP
ncbi:hypothetical protein OOT46_29735 [Aquabacterium sp. A7-Y]|uniref:hypothetical protein n=1 Tax=Aquabacterium sp. A7-Y TaxID=1349605 RepID=UPI00223DD902|nr:hypothetical protein [Aquabacterium sp. A7-Y]MCW7541983.1 hypothetical protein [Aquabacterium sp. A7-Y]